MTSNVAILTPIELNKIIVNLRKVIGAGILYVVRKLTHQIEIYKKAKNEKKKRRIQRYIAEIQVANKLKAKKDEISKFALTNVKTFQQLGVTNTTLPETAVMYKVATSTVVLKSIDAIRKKYVNWHQEIPFFLQRFGKNSKSKKVEKILQNNEDDEEKLMDDNDETKFNLSVSSDANSNSAALDEEQKNNSIEKVIQNKNQNQTNFNIKNDKLNTKKNNNKKINKFNKLRSNNNQIDNVEFEKKVTLKQELKNIKKKSSKFVEKKNVIKHLTQNKKTNDCKIINNKTNSDVIHPSWEAARLKKEQEQTILKNSLCGKSLNKRIKFDDSDSN